MIFFKTSILNNVKIANPQASDEDVIKAFQVKARDFEDCLMATCALSNKCDGIITRNKKDFETFGIEVLCPDEFLSTVGIKL